MKNLFLAFFLFICTANIKAQNYIDWSKIGRDFNGAIQESVQQQEMRKAELDKITNDNIANLSSRYINTDHEIVSKLFEAFKSSAIEELRNYNYYLKSGQLNPLDFNLINSNCVNQFDAAVGSLNSLNYRLNQINRYSESYRNVNNAIFSYLNNSDIKFNTVYQKSGRYNIALSQSYLISIRESYGQVSNPSIQSFFSKINSLII
jgi:hypothetical protein